jgi:predicted Zn-dependent protease
LRVKFSFPIGWRLESDKKGITAYADDSDAAISVIRMPYANGVSPRQFVTNVLGLEAIRDGKDITISGQPAFIGIAERAPSPFGMRPLRIAVVFDARTRSAYVFSGSGRKDLSKLARDQDFIATIFSFDKLDYEERHLADPTQIKVVRLEEGQSIEDLARISPISGYPAEILRLLNSLEAGEQPRPGEFFKLVD